MQVLIELEEPGMVSTTPKGRTTAHLLSLGDCLMSSIYIMADHEAETINGGWWTSISANSYTWKSASTSFNQVNTANNFGIGLLMGAGNATSEQLNLASITTIIG